MIVDLPTDVGALRRVQAERAEEVVAAQALLLALQGAAGQQQLENPGAIRRAVDQAREDLESAVQLWLVARAELWRRVEAAAGIRREEA